VLGFREYAPRRCRRLTGTVAYLSNTWVDNYYHWMQLTLPLLDVYRKALPELAIDHYYIGDAKPTRFQLETLDRIGIRPEQIVSGPCQGDRLLYGYMHCFSRGHVVFRPNLAHDYVRRLLDYSAPARCGEGRRLYVSRGTARNRRRLANEGELIEFLTARGFEVVAMTGRSVAEQAALFASASMIVSLHGSALTNLIFATPGCQVVEIFPYDYDDACWYGASAHGALPYAFIRCDPPSAHDGENVLDMRRFERLYDLALERAAARWSATPDAALAG
jgi:capsular polysaccharide biosynthesis protein